MSGSVRPRRPMGAALLVVAPGAAGGGGAPSAPPRPPPVAVPREPLNITIVYPATAEPIQAQDSSFLFGSVGQGRGDVALSVNGFPVHVSANGTWLAWIPLPSDSLARFQIVARAGASAEPQETTFVARIAQPFRPPPGATAWIDTTSFTPTDTLAFPAGEGIRLSVRATPGAQVGFRMEGKQTPVSS